MMQFMFSMNQGWSSRWISRCLTTIFGLTIFMTVIWTPAVAATPATLQPATEVKVSLGNSANELKFFPSNLEFVAGKRYKLLLDNPSSQKHYFTAKDFADVSWTQKVQAGKVEVKGAIHELELQPGGEAEWVFVPMKPGTYELHCSIKGHTEAGMVGTIAIARN
ncbi:MAG: multicopper oxidase domain-containing protein [Symploca sp. SIO2C1]|nr:multicopper oxidase domain-containing protein [Symploca sp. SIO2C1]